MVEFNSYASKAYPEEQDKMALSVQMVEFITGTKFKKKIQYWVVPFVALV